MSLLVPLVLVGGGAAVVALSLHKPPAPSTPAPVSDPPTSAAPPAKGSEVTTPTPSADTQPVTMPTKQAPSVTTSTSGGPISADDFSRRVKSILSSTGLVV